MHASRQTFFSTCNNAGFALAEALIAAALLAVSLVVVAQLLGIAANSTAAAKETTFATILATQKIEQLRSLAWTFQSGAPISDTSSNTAAAVETPVGGTGLAPSPPDTLRVNTDGYVDYVDASGAPLGGGSTLAPGAAFVRRWSIEPLSGNPDNALVLQVVVTDVRTASQTNPTSPRRNPGEARLVTVRTRKTP